MTDANRGSHSWLESCVRATAIIVLLSCVSCAPDDGDELNDESNAWIEQLDRDNVRKFSGNADYLVLPGLLADRKHQFVDLYATATGQAADVAIDVLIASRDNETAEPLAESFASSREVPANLIRRFGVTSKSCLKVQEFIM